MLRRYEITDEYYKENERFYIKKRKETNNTWYDLRILKTKYRRAESWLISGNYSAVERIISEEINVFLRENGYLAVETYLKPKGNDRKRIANSIWSWLTFIIIPEDITRKQYIFMRNPLDTGARRIRLRRRASWVCWV